MVGWSISRVIEGAGFSPPQSRSPAIRGKAGDWSAARVPRMMSERSPGAMTRLPSSRRSRKVGQLHGRHLEFPDQPVEALRFAADPLGLQDLGDVSHGGPLQQRMLREGEKGDGTSHSPAHNGPQFLPTIGIGAVDDKGQHLAPVLFEHFGQTLKGLNDRLRVLSKGIDHGHQRQAQVIGQSRR